MSSILGIAALLGSLLYLIASVEYALLLRRTGYAFLPIFLFSAVLCITSQSYALDLLHVSFLSASFLLVFQQGKHLKKSSGSWYFFWSIPALALLAAITALFLQEYRLIHLYVYIICCIGALLIAEQLIRNNGGLIKAVGLGMSALLLFNLYIYASALVVGQVDQDSIQARTLAHTSVIFILVLAPALFPHEESRRRRVGLSRPLVFTTTSLMIAGGLLLGISTLGFLFRMGGEEFAAIIQPFLLFLTVLVIGFTLASSNSRARARVWINRHFFKTKYDYNVEWRNLSERLTPANGDMNFAKSAILAVTPIYHGSGGTCYLKEGDQYLPRASLNPRDNPLPISIRGNEQFFEKLQDNWIFLPASNDTLSAANNELIPGEFEAIDSTLLILPLIKNAELFGLLTISANPQHADSFDWEDLDLLHMVSKQVANFVGYQMLSNEMVVTRQFEAFHQFTTFIVHDFKNLIAQQALVVQNATRFIDNPEFIADAIKTIDNSVKKMNRILLRLSQKQSPEGQSISATIPIQDCIDAAIDNCKGRAPIPTREHTDITSMVNADQDSLTMALTHLLTNAQEACAEDGQITIELAVVPDQIICRIIDNGTGMDQDFIDHRLFKPFDSTKKNQGMGVGAYQCRQILSKMDGSLNVTSKLGDGSCFTITLPMAKESSADTP